MSKHKGRAQKTGPTRGMLAKADTASAGGSQRIVAVPSPPTMWLQGAGLVAVTTTHCATLLAHRLIF